MKPEQIYYYSDELEDEFSGVKRDTVTVDKSYRYLHSNYIWRMCSWILYRVIMTPVAYLFMKIKFHLKIVNRSVLTKDTKERKNQKNSGIFLYGNHTQIPGDGFLPSILTFPVRDYVVVNADNISLRGTRTFMEMVGALVLPNHISGMKNYMKAVKYRIARGNAVAIYPEAHIWPYYTGIRAFKPDSFTFPVMYQVPAYCFTVTYQKRGYHKKPRMTVYVDGPFYSDSELKNKAAAQQLRDQIYQTMKERSSASDYEYIKYIKR